MLPGAAASSQSYLTHLAGSSNIQVFNAPFESIFKDLRQVFVWSSGWERSINAVRLMFDILRFHNTTRNESLARYLIICHSRGAIETKMALEMLKMVDPEALAKVEVLAIAPATFIPRDLTPNVTHIIGVRDYVHLLDLVSFAHAALVDRSVHYSSWKHKKGVTPFLFEHGFQDPSFKQPLQERLFKFSQDYEF